MLKRIFNCLTSACLTLVCSICLASSEQCIRTEICVIGLPIIGGGLGCINFNRCEPKEPKALKEPSEPKEPKEPRIPRVPGRPPDRQIPKSL